MLCVRSFAFCLQVVHSVSVSIACNRLNMHVTNSDQMRLASGTVAGTVLLAIAVRTY